MLSHRDMMINRLTEHKTESKLYIEQSILCLYVRINAPQFSDLQCMKLRTKAIQLVCYNQFTELLSNFHFNVMQIIYGGTNKYLRNSSRRLHGSFHIIPERIK